MIDFKEVAVFKDLASVNISEKMRAAVLKGDGMEARTFERFLLAIDPPSRFSEFMYQGKPIKLGKDCRVWPFETRCDDSRNFLVGFTDSSKYAIVKISRAELVWDDIRCKWM